MTVENIQDDVEIETDGSSDAFAVSSLHFIFTVLESNVFLKINMKHSY